MGQKKDQNTFSTLLVAKNNYNPIAYAVHGYGHVLIAMSIMLWKKLEAIEVDIEVNCSTFDFFGVWYYMDKSII